MTNEPIHETYKRILCSNCKNKDTNICEIRKNIKGNMKCCYYERSKKQDGYKPFKGRTANQNKPLMKNILK